MQDRRTHGGEDKENIKYDFSVNLNPLGMPAAAARALHASPESFEEYPDTDCLRLRKALAEMWHVPAENIVCGAGAADIIYRLPVALGLRKVLLAVPSFTEYERAFEINGVRTDFLPASEENSFALTDEFTGAGGDYDAIVISNPVNPSGRLMSVKNYERLLDWCRQTDTKLISDECFMSFAGSDRQEAFRKADDAARKAGTDLILIRSFTKIFCMAGLRAGYAVFSRLDEAEKTALMGPPWNVSGPAQKAALSALGDPDFIRKTVDFISRERNRIFSGLREAGLAPMESNVNFILFRAADDFGRQMKESGILVRDCSDYRGVRAAEGMKFYRTAVRSREENDALLAAVRQTASASGPAAAKSFTGRTARPHQDTLDMSEINGEGPASIMIQGTMSNAGKSLIAAGLCRIFRQDGYRPAPFKSQNMALNSFITADGSEIGRAQAVQAEAAGIAPISDMNPVLLKPTTEKGSQVIVNGKVRADMDASDYFRFRKTLRRDVSDAYERLGRDHDVIVIEGAGSPVEINLTEDGDDFVNMGLAAMTDSPVLLVGDIDRGGVFAQLGGTMMLFDRRDRKRVKGVIVNKFRGDMDLFSRGQNMLAEVCGVPVVGVVPYTELDIDDEDSLSSRLSNHRGSAVSSPEGSPADGEIPDQDVLNVCVIRLPHISNFSDFTALAAVRGVNVFYTDKPEELEKADAVIIPGSKNTIGDLRWMKDTGLADAVKTAAAGGTLTVGICGGYQMLGLRIDDRDHAESMAGSEDGLGLLPVLTDYEAEKITRQTAAVTCRLPDPLTELSGLELAGYEIHMGRSRILSYDEIGNTAPGHDKWGKVSSFSKTESGNHDGCSAGNVFGTYLHGLFDSRTFTEAFCNMLAGARGLRRNFTVSDYQAYRESQYDRLADVLRAHLDMDHIYRIMGLK